jgi:chromosomal replication initiation ATPase DnaA
MNEVLRPRQLLLALQHTESFAREDFLEGPSNAAALALIDSWPDWPNRIMALTGPEGAGKSHLGSIWAEASGARRLSARHLTEDGVPAALATGALVLEDLEPGAFDERALFHLFNLAREEQGSVLITGRESPANFRVAIRDLGSRLRTVPSVLLQPPGDALLRLVMLKLASDRQIALDPTVVNYLSNRIERSFAAAKSVVARLDQESLRQRRPVTRAFAAELFRDPAETIPPAEA